MAFVNCSRQRDLSPAKDEIRRGRIIGLCSEATERWSGVADCAGTRQYHRSCQASVIVNSSYSSAVAVRDTKKKSKLWLSRSFGCWIEIQSGDPIGTRTYH